MVQPHEHVFSCAGYCIECHRSKLSIENDRLRAENERLQSALKVIRTWAKVDGERQAVEWDTPLLDLVQVMGLCDRALNPDAESAD